MLKSALAFIAVLGYVLLFKINFFFFLKKTTIHTFLSSPIENTVATSSMMITQDDQILTTSVSLF